MVLVPGDDWWVRITSSLHASIPCHNINIHTSENRKYLEQCHQYIPYCTLLQVPFNLYIRRTLDVAGGSRQKVAAVDSLRQLVTAARHAPSFLSPADNWAERERVSQHKTARQPSMWGLHAGMTSTFPHSHDVTPKCLQLSDKYTLMLGSDLLDISNLKSLYFWSYAKLLVALLIRIASISEFYKKFSFFQVCDHLSSNTSSIWL